MLHTLTRDEFSLAEHFGAAGPVTDLGADTVTRFRDHAPDWAGKHWVYSEPDDRGARYLHPANITTD